MADLPAQLDPLREFLDTVARQLADDYLRQERGRREPPAPDQVSRAPLKRVVLLRRVA